MYISTNYQRTGSEKHQDALMKTIIKMSENEIELGTIVVIGQQSFRVTHVSDIIYPDVVSEDVSSLRDGVDWLVSKLCSGEVYYHFISNITVFRLV